MRREPSRSRLIGWAAGLTVLALLVSGCQLGGSSSSPGASASRPATQQATSSAAGSGSATAQSTASATHSWSPAATAPASNPPVASYDPAAHAVFTGYTSPDRQTPAASQATPAGFTAAPSGSGMDRYLNRQISWTDCGNFQCARIVVPLDWDKPDGQAITLAVKRKAATQRSGGKPADGTMFINPGGPGVSGQSMLDHFQADQFPGYDIIAWDPRGSGQSTPVACGTAAQTDAYFNLNSSPSNQSQWDAVIAGNKAFAQQCRTSSGVLLDHISTIDTARDLDYLRHQVGDSTLNYLGISYGTYIGAMYAELYPGRVGRMVLDSAVNITDNDSVSQVMGFDKAFRAFAQWCAGSSSCGLGDSTDGVVNRTVRFLEGLNGSPMRVGLRPLTQNQAATGLAYFLYSGKDSYGYLAGALSQAIQGRNGAVLLAAADALNGRDLETGKWDSSAYAFPSILCGDWSDDGLAGARQQWAEDQKRAPILGRSFGVGLICTYWTVKPARQLRITAQGAAPIVVLGVTGDPATPYQQAQWMSDQLASGVLVTWRGAGHSAWELGNTCLRNSVTGYLNDGVVPKDKTTC